MVTAIVWGSSVYVFLKLKEQLKALFQLLDNIEENATKNKAKNNLNNINGHIYGVESVFNMTGGGVGKDATSEIKSFKGIIFVEQVTITYPLSYLINQHFNNKNNQNNSIPKQCTKCGLDKMPLLPVSLPVSGVGSMLDTMRYIIMKTERYN